MASKDKVLAYLECNKDKYISGESIANELGISRNAIWKAINELRKAGYQIDAVSNKGYKLAGENDILSAAGIISYLNLKLADTYKKDDLIHIYDTVNSTNRLAKEMAIAGAASGTILVADEQTEGRAKKANSFYSPKGGLYLSILLRPDQLANMDNGKLPLATGQAVCSAINSLTGLEAVVKPINDIYIGDKKVCGILTEAESEFETGELQWIVIGIGINKPLAASFSRNQLVAAILENIIEALSIRN